MRRAPEVTERAVVTGDVTAVVFTPNRYLHPALFYNYIYEDNTIYFQVQLSPESHNTLMSVRALKTFV